MSRDREGFHGCKACLEPTYGRPTKSTDTQPGEGRILKGQGPSIGAGANSSARVGSLKPP